METELSRLKRERKKFKDELQQIASEEKALTEEKQSIEPQLEKIRQEMKEAGPELTLADFKSLETKEVYLRDHREKLIRKIGELQARRQQMHTFQQLNFRRIFNEVINLEGQEFREKNLDAILRLICLGRLAGGVKLDDLLTHIFQLNSPETGERFKAMYSQMLEEYQAE